MKSNSSNNKLKIIIVIFIILLIISISAIFIYIQHKENQEKYDEYNQEITYREVIQENIIKYEVPSNWVSIERNEVENALFYAPNIDLTGESGIFYTTYGDSTDNYEIMKKSLIDAHNKVYIDNKESEMTSYKINEFTNSNGYNVIEFINLYENETPTSTEYFIYIIGPKNYGLIWAIDFEDNKIKDIYEILHKVVDTMYIYK